jgi:GT2 family glycosyltransferase
MPNFETLCSIPGAKKISYFLFVSEAMLKSKVETARLMHTINSIISQSVPLCDLLIISAQKISIKVTNIIEDCLAKFNSEFDPLFKFNRPQKDIDLSSIKNDSTHADPTIFYYISCEDSLVSAIDLLKDVVMTQWIVFVDNRVSLLPSATYELTQAVFGHSDSRIIYTDHVEVYAGALIANPVFKPLFSLDLLYSQNYIGNLICINANVLDICNFKGLNYYSNVIFSLFFFLIEKLRRAKSSRNNLNLLTRNIVHLPTILYSKIINKSVIGLNQKENSEQLKVLKDHMSRCYSGVTCTLIKPFVFRHKWKVSKPEPCVSLIIPTKNGYEILKSCINSIIKKTTYKNYEIIIVDNQTTDVKTLEYLDELALKYRFIKIIRYKKKFNYSDINNTAVRQTKGTILGFLNNDIEVISPGWLTEMVSHAVRRDIGCVGAMHYYPDGYIQHAGVVVGMHGVADHAFAGCRKPSHVDRWNYLDSIRNPDAVTAATLLVRRELFDLVAGFDSKKLKIAFNDVDLCLKISAQGYRCLWTPYAELFHHESKTRKVEILDSDARLTEQSEHRVMKKRWKTDSYVARDLLKASRFS